MSEIKISMEGLEPFLYSLAYVTQEHGEPNRPFNVGLLVYSIDTGEVASKQSANQVETLKAVDELTLGTVSGFFANLEQSIQPYLLIDEQRMQKYPDWLTALATEKTGSLRFSMPRDIISVSIDEALLELSRQYLEDDDN